MQNNGDHRCLQGSGTFDWQIDRGRGFRFDSVAEAAEGAVDSQSSANCSYQRVESCRPVSGGLDNNLQFRAMLIMIAQWRQRDLRLPRLAIAEDDKPGKWDTLGQDFVAQDSIWARSSSSASGGL